LSAKTRFRRPVPGREADQRRRDDERREWRPARTRAAPVRGGSFPRL